MVYTINNLYLIDNLFELQNDMAYIKNDSKFDQFQLMAFRSTKSVVSVDALLGIQEINLLLLTTIIVNRTFPRISSMKNYLCLAPALDG